MITISKDLAPKLAELKQRLESVEDPSKTLSTTKAEVRLIETQYSIASTRGFEVIQDEPPPQLREEDGDRHQQTISRRRSVSAKMLSSCAMRPWLACPSRVWRHRSTVFGI